MTENDIAISAPCCEQCNKRTRPAPFQVIELDGDADGWAAAFNTAAEDGYELVSIVDRRAVLRR